jgi:type IV pilus assembly protein PilC
MSKRTAITQLQEVSMEALIRTLRPIFSVYTSLYEKIKGKQKKGKKKFKETGLKKRPVTLSFGIQDQIFFAKRLAMILRAGMPIMRGLEMLGSEVRSSSAAYIFQTLTTGVSNGQPLSSGLAKFERIFGQFCINIVKVGETSGTLHENLDYLAEELKKKQALRTKVVGALIYPAVIVIATVAITVMLTVFIFPKIVPIFQSVKATLPLSTRLLMQLSHFFSEWGFWLLGGLVVSIIGFIVLMRVSRRFHLWMDILLLRMPIFGTLSQNYNLANSTRTLGLLLKSDVRVVQSIELVAASTHNLVYQRALYAVAEQVVHGRRISEEMKTTPRLFPSLMTQMMLVGESTGNLSSSLLFLSDMYEEEISELTKRLTTMLEPILMIVMGLVVGFIAVSIIMPIYSITQNLTPH